MMNIASTACFNSCPCEAALELPRVYSKCRQRWSGKPQAECSSVMTAAKSVKVLCY